MLQVFPRIFSEKKSAGKFNTSLLRIGAPGIFSTLVVIFSFKISKSFSSLSNHGINGVIGNARVAISGLWITRSSKTRMLIGGQKTLKKPY